MADLPKLKIDAPVGKANPGRGFYQLEDDLLYVQVGDFTPERRFFNYLESDPVRFHIDRLGRLMLVEVTSPRRQWTVASDLTVPGIGERADVHFLDFRERIAEPELLTDPDRSILLVRFAHAQSWHWYVIADSVLIQTDGDNRMTALMVSEIEDDLAGRQIAFFRKYICRP